MFELLAALALGYFVGSFPSAALVARLWGRDIFEVGSGNMGAMNTARNVGWLPGATVLTLDVAKGALAVIVTQAIASDASGPAYALPLAAGTGAVAGHAWPAFTRLRGGKALATTLGVSLPIYPLPGIYTMLLLVALVLLTRRTTLASITAIVAYPFIVMALLSRSAADVDQAFSILTSVLLIAAIVVWKHLRPLSKAKRSGGSR